MNTIQTNKWNQWFAGVMDGDGYFYINKKENSVSLEIITDIFCVKVLYSIKQVLGGGSVKLRSNSKSVRYRVKKSEIIIDALKRINGKLYNKRRLAQFQAACALKNVITVQTPPLIDSQSPYIAGMLDSDGTITLSVSKSSAENSILSGVEGKIQRLIHSRGNNQLTLKVNGIDKHNIEVIQKSYNLGRLYQDQAEPGKNAKTTKPQTLWVIRSFEEFAIIYELLKKYPLKSYKMHRIRLIPIYFQYKQLQYHCSKKGSFEFKQWEKFCRLWHKYNY